MRAKFAVVSLFLALFAALDLGVGAARAGDWRSQYNTGKQTGNLFQSCCGDKDCRTWAQLGYPKIIRRDDRGYDVRLNGYWLSYDFPAVHASHDDNTWICYLKSNAEPDPLCLFLPPGII